MTIQGVPIYRRQQPYVCPECSKVISKRLQESLRPGDSVVCHGFRHVRRFSPLPHRFTRRA